MDDIRWCNHVFDNPGLLEISRLAFRTLNDGKNPGFGKDLKTTQHFVGSDTVTISRETEKEEITVTITRKLK